MVTDNIIQEIYAVRNAAKQSEIKIENAKFRLSQTPGDDMWSRIKQEEEKKHYELGKQYAALHAQLISLKPQCSKEEYESLLQQYGTVIGMTENINHVEDSLHDEHDLHKAIEQTSHMIEKVRSEIEFAKENLDEDIVTMLSAELSYYENDMKKHYWGESKLESMYSEETKKTK